MSSACEVCSHASTDHALRDGSTLDRCPSCGHVRRDLDQCPAHHRSLAYGGDPGLDRIRQRLTEGALDRAVTVPAAGSVFEIGYGAGGLLRHYLDRGLRVAGCDPDQLERPVDPEVAARGDLQRVPLELVDTRGAGQERGGHDLVVGVHVIEHVQDLAASLSATHDLLTPGGRLALLTPAADSLSLTLFSDAWWLLEDPTHVRFLSATSARQALERAGFVDVRVRRLLLDNLTMEGASLVRLLRPRAREGGVLEGRLARWTATLLAPVAVLLRLVVPRARPTILVTGRRADA